MDPVSAFGLAASVLQVATTAVKTVHTVEQLIHRFHAAPQSVDALFSESSVVSATLSHLIELFERKDNTVVAILSAKPELEKALKRALSGCTAVFQDLEKDLHKILPPSPSESSDKLSIRRRTSFLWKQDIFKDYLAKIHGHQNVLTLLMQALQMHSLSDISYLLQDTNSKLADMSREQQVHHGLASKAPSYTSEVETDLEKKVADSTPYRRVANMESGIAQPEPDQPALASSLPSVPVTPIPAAAEPIMMERTLAEPILADALPAAPISIPTAPAKVESTLENDLIDLTERPSILDAAIEEQISPAFNDLLVLDSSFNRNGTSTVTFQRDSAHSMVVATPSVVFHPEANHSVRRASSILTPLSAEGHNGGFFGRSLSTSSSNADSTRSASLQSEFPEVVGNEEPTDHFPRIECPPPFLPLSTEDELAMLQERHQTSLKSGNIGDQLEWAEDALHFTSIGTMYRDRISRLQSTPAEAASVERMLETDAKQLVETQSQQGIAKALFLKGMYLGLNVAKSTEFHIAALSKGYSRAAFYIAMMYESNKATKTAINYYKQGAEGGDSACNYRLAQAHLGGELGQKKDHKKAIDYLQKAAAKADADYPQALFLLAVLQTESYRRNFKISKGILPIDEAAAKENFVAAARIGCSKSQLRMGHAYGSARLGCPKSCPIALHYLRLAARQGESDAELQISTWFGWGQAGVLEPDEKLAFIHARRAAASGLVPGLCQVGYFYELGIGVEKNPPKAKEWYLKAAAKGDQVAQARLDALRGRGVVGIRS